MQKEFKNIVFELAKSISDFDSIKALVIFGSVAKGEADKRSDVDLLVIFNTMKKRFKDENRIFALSQEIGRKYDKSVQMIFSNRNFDKLDRKFIETILKEGIVLYGNLPSLKAGRLMLEPYLIFNFELAKMEKKHRNKLDRALFGYKTKKKYKSKLYKSSSEGLAKEYNCIKLGPSSLIIPFRNSTIFEKLFKGFDIKYTKTSIWTPRA